MGMQEWLPQVQADYEECLSRLPPRSVGFLDRRLEYGYNTCHSFTFAKVYDEWQV